MINMTYIEIKTVYGRQYKYLRRAVRIGEKVQHINLKYLGPVNPVYKIEQKRKSNASVYIRQLKEGDIKELTTATKSTDAFKRDRAKILLLSSYLFSSLIPKFILSTEKFTNFDYHTILTDKGWDI